MAAAFTESISGSANDIPGLNSASSTSMCLLRSAEIEETRVCVIQFLQTLSSHLPTMPRCAQLAGNSPTPSNTFHVSPDKWELSVWSLSLLQPIVLVEVMHGTVTASQGGFSLQEDVFYAMEQQEGYWREEYRERSGLEIRRNETPGEITLACFAVAIVFNWSAIVLVMRTKAKASGDPRLKLALYRVVTRDADCFPELGRQYQYQKNVARSRTGILIAYLRSVTRTNGWPK
jgi:hypothetical protein